MANFEYLKEVYRTHKIFVEGMAETLAPKREELATKLEACRIEWEQSNAELLKLEAEGKDAVARSENELRSAILEDFASNGNKQPHPGLSVRVNTSLKYDEPEALKWAKEHSMCLSLDKKAFEKVASADLSNMPFVEVVEKPTAVISLKD